VLQRNEQRVSSNIISVRHFLVYGPGAWFTIRPVHGWCGRCVVCTERVRVRVGTTVLNYECTFLHFIPLHLGRIVVD